MHSTLCAPPPPLPSPKYGISYYFKCSWEYVVLRRAIEKYSLCKVVVVVVVVVFFWGGGEGANRLYLMVDSKYSKSLF